MSKRFIAIVAGLVVVGCAAIILTRPTAGPAHVVKHKEFPAPSPSTQSDTWVKNGVFLSQVQHDRLAKLGDDAIAHHNLPPQDVDYLIETIADPQTQSTSPSFIHFQAAYDLSQMREFTPDQRSRILKACTPLSKSELPLDKRCLIVVARAMHDPVARPQALAMLKEGNENNQKAAKLYLTSLGN